MYLKHCGDDVFYVHTFGLKQKKNQCYCSTSDIRNRYSKAKGGRCHNKFSTQCNSRLQFPSDKTPFSVTALMVCHMLLCCQLPPHLLDIQAFISMGCKERARMRSTETSQDIQHMGLLGRLYGVQQHNTGFEQFI